MRRYQSKGGEPAQSVASADGPINHAFDRIRDTVGGASPWELGALAAGVVIALVGAFFVLRVVRRSWARSRDARQRASKSVLELGGQVLPAFGGIAVSLYGLWGFATDQAQLPTWLRIGFIATFDLAELTLFWMLHRAASARAAFAEAAAEAGMPADEVAELRGWTPGMRRIQSLAWTLVVFSAAMNAIHAHVWAGRLVLFAIPVLAAKLIELQVQDKLFGDAEVEERGGRPGPVRLVIVLWQRLWASLFASLDLDAGATNQAMAREARVRRAVDRVIELGRAHQTYVDAQAATGRQGEKDKKRARAEVDRLKDQAGSALDLADIATDPRARLAFFRRMAGRTRTLELATHDYGDTTRSMAFMEELAVVPAAELIESSARAAEAEKERERAEAARQQAEEMKKKADDARKAAEDARKRAEDKERAAREELERAEAARKKAEDEATKASADAARAREEMERAEAARKAAEDARQRAADERAAEDQRRAEAEASRLRLEQTAATAKDRHDWVAGEAQRLANELAELNEARARAVRELEEAQRQEREAKLEAGRAQTRQEEAEAQAQANARAAELARELREQEEARRKEAFEEAAAARSEIDQLSGVLNGLRDRVVAVIPEPSVAPDGPTFPKSPAKQRAWDIWLAAKEAGAEEPSPEELLAGEEERNPGNVRNWRREFRQLYDEMIAARAARAQEDARNGAARMARGDSNEPRGHHADDHDLPRAGGLIAGQRTGG